MRVNVDLARHAFYAGPYHSEHTFSMRDYQDHAVCQRGDNPASGGESRRKANRLWEGDGLLDTLGRPSIVTRPGEFKDELGVGNAKGSAQIQPS
ncbi:hypothetical protein ACLKA7_001373 [Drosophila subpalustris]